MNHRIFRGHDDENEILVQIWEEMEEIQVIELATRPRGGRTWGPPISLAEELP